LARNICEAERSRGRQARVLVVALEVTTSLLRTELESLDEEGERGGGRPNVASTIFSDGSSAMVVGADVGGEWEEGGELGLGLGWLLTGPGVKRGLHCYEEGREE
jgi:type III polyketide synthase